MAVGTEKVSSLAAHKIARSFPMNACFPISIEVTMAFAAESVALCKIDELPVVKPKFIPVLCVVAVEAPSHGFSVMELNVGVFFLEFPLFSIHFHGGMTIAARKHALRDGGRRNRKLFNPHGRRYEINRQEEKYGWGNYSLHAYEKGGIKGGTDGLAPSHPSAESAAPCWSRPAD